MATTGMAIVVAELMKASRADLASATEKPRSSIFRPSLAATSNMVVRVMPRRMPRSAGLVTSADLLTPGDPGILEWIGPALPYVDYLLPNDEQVLALTESATLADGARLLLDRGVGSVVATRQARGALVVTAGETIAVPAFAVEVVDTTGCGDAFSAGFLRGLSLGRDRRAAATLGCATAALVAQGLGTDHGTFDLDTVEAFAADTATR